MKYKNTQFGWIVIGIFVSVILFLFLAYLNQWGNNPLPLIPLIVLGGLFIFICALFYKLTIEFDGSVLKVIYGFGLISFSLKIDQLIAAKSITIPWYWGLGIRFTPKGMMYNIQGSKGVKIEYISNGKRKSVMVGTQDPERLKQVLDEGFKK